MLKLSLLLTDTIQPIAEKSVDEFARLDPLGVGMVLVAMIVVFTVLISLLLFFKFTAKLHTSGIKSLRRKRKPIESHNIEDENPSGETLAAISLALYLYEKELQGVENATITIKNISKRYSPWSSKLHGLRSWPNK